MMGKNLGILGGMGPLASAKFLSTVYRLNLVEPEQEAPNCILLSDPSFPNRTKAILAGNTGGSPAVLRRPSWNCAVKGRIASSSPASRSTTCCPRSQDRYSGG